MTDTIKFRGYAVSYTTKGDEVALTISNPGGRPFGKVQAARLIIEFGNDLMEAILADICHQPAEGKMHESCLDTPTEV